MMKLSFEQRFIVAQCLIGMLRNTNRLPSIGRCLLRSRGGLKQHSNGKSRWTISEAL